MPIHDLGYRSWSGDRSSQWIRPWVIAQAGISLVWSRKWLRTILMVGWLPIMFPAFGVFAFEYSSTNPAMQETIVGMVNGPLNQPELAATIRQDPESARHQIWSVLILTYFRYPQLFTMVLLVGLTGPRLISYDLRTRAYLLYFSRPLSPLQYVLGKSAVIWFLLAMIATVPALLVYVVGVLLSPDLSVVLQTWDIPLRILAASAVLMVPTTALALAYSSVTTESRYAKFAWFATWTMGFVAYQVLTSTTLVMKSGGSNETGIDTFQMIADRWRLLSPYHTLGLVQSWVFGVTDATPGTIAAIVLLAAITLLGFLIVRWRIVARLSV